MVKIRKLMLGRDSEDEMFYKQIVGSYFSTTKDDYIVQFFRLLNVTFTAPVLLQIIENVARLYLMMKALCRQRFNICEYLTFVLHSLLAVS